MLGVSPDWFLNVLLVHHRVICGVLNVRSCWRQGFVVTSLWQVTDSECSVSILVLQRGRFRRELAVASVCLTHRVEAAVLLDAVIEGTIHDQGSSSLVV